MSGTIRDVLLDIEGTTCPVSFVSEVLFPYAAAGLNDFLQSHWREEAVQQLMREVLQAWGEDPDPEAMALHRQLQGAQFTLTACGDGRKGAEIVPAGTLAPLVAYLQSVSRRDRKLSAWKDLQGRIWEEGYRRGELQATLFPDVAPALRRWHGEGLRLSVYSSGSVAAQQLLYGHCQEGDLRHLFYQWFDTRIGRKQEPASYTAIARALQRSPEQILFLSDAGPELEAASRAGLEVICSERPGNPSGAGGTSARIRSLNDLQPSRWPHPLP